MWNCRKQSSGCEREKLKRLNLKSESIDARNRGGIARSSDEVSVMEMERRGSVK
jgi:RNA-directed DNA polymerase